MRGSGWLLPIGAAIVWVACIGYPGAALINAVMNLPQTDVEIRPAPSLLMTSIGWGAAVAFAAMLAGWAPGRLLGKTMGTRRFIPLAMLMLVPICLPSYVVFYAWWQSWPAESPLHQWLIEHHSMQVARQATLFAGLVCWSWPLVGWCVAGSAANRPAQRDEMLLIDGAGRYRRLLDYWRSDWRGLALGGLLVFLATLANTTCFDLAEVFTFSNEVRAVQALGANARDVLAAGAPMMMIAAIGAVTIWFLLGARRSVERRIAQRMASGGRWLLASAAIIWILSVVLPVGLFTRSILTQADFGRTLEEFTTLYRWSVMNTLAYAVVSGLLGAAVAVGQSAMWQDERRWIRFGASLMTITWLLAAALPGTMIGLALLAGYNVPWLDRIVADSPMILVAAHVASFGFAAALLARWLARREPMPLRDLRRLDGAQSLGAIIESTQPRLVAAAVAAFAVVFVLAVGEISVTALVAPPSRPGAGPLASSLLNDMHYQRPQTVMIASLGMIVLALFVSLVVAVVWNWQRSQDFVQRVSSSIFAVALTCPLMLSGCEPDDPFIAAPLRMEYSFGVSGTGPGQFGYPRAIDVDPTRQYLYVIDKQARVQRLDYDGDHQIQWRMPEKENGKPTGVSVAPDGRVFVADTHYFRVIVYDSQGNEQFRFGEFGNGPGQFIYVTDVAFGRDGRLYVSEYGGNDRIQIFDPSGNYLSEFGSPGAEPGQFNRPQAMVFNADQTELFIADACNHRIVVVDPDGKFLRSFSQAGRGAGELTYPYGLAMLPDHTLLVAEFGNNRLQRFDENGKSLGVFGVIGRGPGQLQYPWSVACENDRVFVLDSGNNRVQVIRMP